MQAGISRQTKSGNDKDFSCPSFALKLFRPAPIEVTSGPVSALARRAPAIRQRQSMRCPCSKVQPAATGQGCPAPPTVLFSNG